MPTPSRGHGTHEIGFGHVLARFSRLKPFVTRPGLAVFLSLFIAAAIGTAGCGSAQPPGQQKTSGGGGDDKITIAMLPKLKNIAYFIACQRGAERAAEELGVELIYDGPAKASGSEQNKFIETWIRQGVDAICVAPNQPEGIKRFIERAQQRGIAVLTWDTDAPECGRSIMVNQIDDETLGHMLMDDLAEQMNEQGEWAIAIASLDASNLNNWRRIAEARAEEKYPGLELVDTVVTEEDEEKARQSVETLLNKHPNLGGIIAFDSNSVPGAAEAIDRAGKAGEVALTGNTGPGKMRDFIKRDVLKSFYLWDPRELGALTVHLAAAIVKGEDIKPGSELPGFGKLRFSDHDPTMVILSDPIRFTKENIDEYDWKF